MQAEILYDQALAAGEDIAFELAVIHAAILCVNLPTVPEPLQDHAPMIADLRRAAITILHALDWLDEDAIRQPTERD